MEEGNTSKKWTVVVLGNFLTKLENMGKPMFPSPINPMSKSKDMLSVGDRWELLTLS